MTLPERLEKGLPIWSRLYKVESLQSRLYGAKAEVMALMSDIACEEEVEPLTEFIDYLDAAIVRLDWVHGSLHAHTLKVTGSDRIPPQSGPSSSEGRGTVKSSKSSKGGE